VFVLPEEQWTKTGALTGACWHDGALYVMKGVFAGPPID
jgi:hypothetical protein